MRGYEKFFLPGATATTVNASKNNVCMMKRSYPASAAGGGTDCTVSMVNNYNINNSSNSSRYKSGVATSGARSRNCSSGSASGNGTNNRSGDEVVDSGRNRLVVRTATAGAVEAVKENILCLLMMLVLVVLLKMIVSRVTLSLQLSLSCPPEEIRVHHIKNII